MSLLMLKTKNLSWQDHTLNIEVMLAPLRSTLLLNKHKTLDTKYDKEKALYERQRDACIKDYVVETRLIERRRQKILNRKKELQAEARSKSAMEKEKLSQATQPSNQGRSSSAPIDGRTHPDTPRGDDFHAMLPRLGLKHTPLFGGNLLKPKLFLETGATSSESDAQSQQDFGGSVRRRSIINTFLTADGQLARHSSSQRTKGANVSPTRRRDTDKSPKRMQLPPAITRTSASPDTKPPPSSASSKPPIGATTALNRDRGIPRRVPNVTFLEFLNQDRDDEDEDDMHGSVLVEVKPKTVEDKVKDFLRELESFNSRPPTAASLTDDSIYSSVRSRQSERAKLVANRYHNLSLDQKQLEKAFDRYCERKTHEDLLKAMKLASKMKAHIRQARNTSLVPTVAAFKSSRTFMKLLKRQQRRDRQAQEIRD